MLAGVLLHVVEAPPPVDYSRNLFSRYRPTHNMRDPILFVHYIRHTDPSQLAGVEGLAARSRIESSAVQIDFLTVRTRIHYAGPEFR
jgi:hypothetical protein